MSHVEFEVQATWDGGPLEVDEFARIEAWADRACGVLVLRVEASHHADPLPEVAQGSVDGLWDFEVVELFLLGDDERYLEIELAPEAEFYTMAEAFAARSLNVAQGFARALDLDVAAEDLAAVCDRAREHGLFVTLEFLPWSGIPNAAVACDLIQRTGWENATPMLDTWHWFRGGADLEMLRAIPGDRIGSVQLNDAPAHASADLVSESMTARLMPGEGAIPIVDVVRVLDEIGSTAPLGVEVFNARQASMGGAEVAVACAEATRRILDEARGR